MPANSASPFSKTSRNNTNASNPTHLNVPTTHSNPNTPQQPRPTAPTALPPVLPLRFRTPMPRHREQAQTPQDLQVLRLLLEELQTTLRSMHSIMARKLPVPGALAVRRIHMLHMVDIRIMSLTTSTTCSSSSSSKHRGMQRLLRQATPNRRLRHHHRVTGLMEVGIIQCRRRLECERC